MNKTDVEFENLKSNKSLNFKENNYLSGYVCSVIRLHQTLDSYVPKQFKMDIFHQVHDFAYLRIKTTTKEETSHFI